MFFFIILHLVPIKKLNKSMLTLKSYKDLVLKKSHKNVKKRILNAEVSYSFPNMYEVILL